MKKNGFTKSLASIFSLSLILMSCAEITRAESQQSKSFQSKNALIHYMERGSGELVILLHGYLLDSQSNWIDNGVFELLAEDFRVVAMDIRGLGQSSKPHSLEAYGKQPINDVVNLIKHLGEDQAYLVGYSMGGEIVLSTALAHPNAVKRAVVSGTGWLENEEDYGVYLEWADKLTNRAEGETVSDVLFPEAPLGRFGEIIDANDPDAAAALAQGMVELRVEAKDLQNNRIPVLLLIGENDEYKSMADKAFETGSNMTLKVLPEKTHMTAIFDPLLGTAILEFLQADSE